VRGLWSGSDAVMLRLQAGAVDISLAVPADGTFRFDRGLAESASYRVTVATSPARHTCVVERGGEGTIAQADVTDVSIACTGPAVQITPSGRWTGTFDPAIDAQSFAGSVAMQDVTLTVAGSDLTGARIGGAATAIGQESAPVALALGATTVPVELAAGGLSKTYQLTFDRGAAVLAHVTYGKASNTRRGSVFGFSVSLSGNTLAVGAITESSAAIGVDGDQGNERAPDAGAVYVFVRSGATWRQQAYLKASNTGEGDNFGASVSLSGDTLAVGAEAEESAASGIDGEQTDNSAPRAGAVYVFVRTGTTWKQQAYLKPSNTDLLYEFGHAVSLAGDTLAVGAPGESSAATGINNDQTNRDAGQSGAVYVFVRSGATWTQQAYVKASNTGALDGFGGSVSLSGNTLAVGATGESSTATGVNGVQRNEGAPRAGAAYVFVRSGATWTQQAYVKASNTDAEDLFGQAVSLSGDTLAVSALREASAARGVNGDQANDDALLAGAVYVFARAGSTWTQQAYLKASNTEEGDIFGFALALSGDTLAVGAPAEASAATGVDGDQTDNRARPAGAVYVFARRAGAWAQQAYVKASNTDALDSFGQSIALSRNGLVIGAPGEASAARGIDGDQTDNREVASGAFYELR
jgi:trimeric autotransporter adhesin